MANNYAFNVLPSVNISRSRFARKSQHKTSFNLGDIIPIYVDEVLPGDTRSIDMAHLVRMSTPIAPIMDNIYLDFYAFFVPNRLVWTHWKEFMGENNVSAGIPQQEYTVPVVSTYANVINPGDLADYFGLPVGKSGVYKEVSALPFRAYALIYNEWFRNQNLIAPLAINTGDTNGALVGNNFVSIQKASKIGDYFVTSLPYAQKGQPVSLPLGTSAPVVAATAPGSGTLAITAEEPDEDGTALFAGNADMVIDLTQATAATINQLRYAFQLQKLLEKDALYGSRYFEILAAHFGVISPDARLQRPEYLGGYRTRINVDQVLSTTGYDDTGATDLGKPGANSVTGGKSSIFTKSFVEHGTLMIVCVARHDSTYAQGINRMWTRKGRYDFYFPVFANLGAQAVLNKEIYFNGDSDDDEVFGYQEAWAEYRYKPSIATGLLNPNASGSLDFWTLTEKFASRPTLSKSFIEQGRSNLGRALATGVTGPDFIADFYFEDIAVRPMPMYSIPGLIDHH